MSRRRLWSSIDNNRSLYDMEFTATPFNNYSTFGLESRTSDPCSLHPPESTQFGSLPTSSQAKPDHESKRWGLILLCVALSAFMLSSYSSKTPVLRQPYAMIPPEEWDRNHYNARQGLQQAKRNLLIVQLSNTKSVTYSDISARPNRAYARQWSVDYLLHYSSDQDKCLHQAQLLMSIYEKQLNQDKSFWEEYHEEPRDYQYDVILFLSPDAIITDMDHDILNLLPYEDLISWTQNSKLSMWNLNHDEFQTLAQLWLDESCSTGRLKSVVETVQEDGAATQLTLNDAGFVEPRWVKFLNSEDFTPNSFMTLQTTADAVCYRYYPRCDVL